jgi:hypothetical protein
VTVANALPHDERRTVHVLFRRHQQRREIETGRPLDGEVQAAISEGFLKHEPVDRGPQTEGDIE